MRASYLDYAMSVIIGRALPDVRDGLKPVHRRVLFHMHELGNGGYNRAYKKSARIVGDVIGKYHLTATKRSTIRSFEWHSPSRCDTCSSTDRVTSEVFDGDAPRRCVTPKFAWQKLASELLADIDKETANFGPNYDDSLEEPWFYQRVYPTSSSMARLALPLVWRPISHRIT